MPQAAAHPELCSELDLSPRLSAINAAMRHRISQSDSDTRTHLLDVAIRLFGSRSFESVSVRDLTSEARANLGAVNYYFGSKINLMREVLKTLADPINNQRMRSLSTYLASLKGAGPELEVIIRLLVEPFVRAAKDRNGRGMYYPRLIMQARTLPGNLIGPYISDQNDAMARQYVSAIMQAVPEISEAEAFWRYELIIGATLNIVGDELKSYRLKRLSNGKCDTDDADRIVDELVTFGAAGVRGRAARRSNGTVARIARRARPATRARTGEH